jgi:hypothetical protein
MNKTGVYIFLEVNGFDADEIAKAGFNASGRHHTFTLPLREDSFTTPTDQQQFFSPIEELFKEISAVIGGLGANWISGIADMVVKFQDLFGTRLFNSDLHAQAWRQALPSSLSLKLDFNYGMLDEWDAQKEVLQPLLIIKRSSLPMAAGATYFAPGPTALSVYKEFGTHIFESVLVQSQANVKSALAATNPAYQQRGGGEAISLQVSGAFSDIQKGGAKILADATTYVEAAASTKRGYWALSFVAYDQKTNSKKILFQSPKLICKESTITFGNQLDETLSPIFGSATLSLSSQSPTNSGSYKLEGAWI